MSKTKYEVLEAFGREGGPCGAVLDTADMLVNEHLQVRDMMVEVDHTEYGPMRLLGCPIKVTDGPITFTPARSWALTMQQCMAHCWGLMPNTCKSYTPKA